MRMEKSMEAQTLGREQVGIHARQDGPRDQPCAPHHQGAHDKVDCDSEGLKQTTRLLYQTALMESGRNLRDPKELPSNL
ncbi:hypothetical protein ZWY2020_008501 [Hordeum vulgare]|nr:hypothetical protein ZWY2020_008501 [Hordeum vulgare]